MAQTIHVTEDLIRSASVRDSRRCMIAEAIQLRNPHYRQVMVDLQSIRWTNPNTGKRYLCLTPEDAAKALVAFDHGDEVLPFQVTLRPIQITPVREREVKSDDQLRLEGHDPATAPDSVRYNQTARRGRKRIRRRSSHPADGSIVVEGGVPMVPRGALPGSARALGLRVNPKVLAFDPEKDAGDNVKASRSDVRVYGRRLLRG